MKKKTKVSKNGTELALISAFVPKRLYDEFHAECRNNDETETRMVKIILDQRYGAKAKSVSEETL